MLLDIVTTHAGVQSVLVVCISLIILFPLLFSFIRKGSAESRIHEMVFSDQKHKAAVIEHDNRMIEHRLLYEHKQLQDKDRG